MDLTLELTEEQEALRSEAKKFAEAEIVPIAGQCDKSSRFPKEVLDKAHEFGLINLFQSADDHGTGLTLFETCLVIEELARGCAGMTTSIVANDLALTPIKLAATDEQKERLLRPICKEGKLASFCLSEPSAGSDAASVQAKIEKKGDLYILNGQKQWITNGGYADQYTVFATLDKEKKHKGICCLAVDAKAPGVTTGAHEDKLGQRCSNTVAITFENVEVPVKNLIGGEGQGFAVAMETLDLSRPMTAIIAVGIARAAYEYALGYSQERVQFNKPISSFQSIQFMLADMATNIHAGRLLSLHSAALLDQGKRASLESSMAKRFSADMGMEVTTNAVQIYGGYGYTKDYPVEKLMRDAKLMQIYEGTSQIQRLVIARQLLDKSK